MVDKVKNPVENEKSFYCRIIGEYLKYGSVDKVYEAYDYDLPISYPGFQRLVDRWGIVKAAGPNSLLSEAITFMVLLSNHKIPMEKMYKKMPLSFKTSMTTMHRILHNIKEGVTRRVGTALIVTPFSDQNKVLVGDDVSTPRLELGKSFGSLSLPMGYSKDGEDRRESILRVLQQEVFVKETIDKRFPIDIIPLTPKPFMYFDIADVKVSVYHLGLPESLSNKKSFSSFKIVNHRFLHLSEIINGQDNFRAGIKEIALGYQRYLEDSNNNYAKNPIKQKSEINFELARLGVVVD